MSSLRAAFETYCQKWVRYISSPSEFGGLDLARAFAVLLVVVWHANMVALPFGWTGVDLFFVLSGFLIFSIYKRNTETGTFQLGRFYRDRFLRIYPTYIVIVLIFAALHFSEFSWGKILFALGAYATFTQSYLLVPFEGLFYPVTWTLVVEMLFYVVAPLFFLKLYPRFMPQLILSILLVFPIIRVISIYGVLYLAGHPDVQATFKNFHDLTAVNWTYIHLLLPHFRFDSLWYGVGIAYLALTPSVDISEKMRKIILVIGLCFVGILWFHISFGLGPPFDMPSMTRLTPFESVWVPTLSALSYAMVVFGIYKMKVTNPIIIILARLAYTIYLVHMIVFGMVEGSVLMAMILTFVAALILSFCVEYPFINYYKSQQKQANKRA